MGRDTTERRLRARVERRLEPGEQYLVAVRAWVSPAGRLRAFAIRDRDFAIVTDRRFMLWSSRFWTRRPHRRVLADRLDDMTVEPAGRRAGRKYRLSRPGRDPIVVDFGRGDRAQDLVDDLLTRAGVPLRTDRIGV